MSGEYYFVGTSLPDLKIGQQPEISFENLQRLLKDNLSGHDYAQTQVLRRYFDILNLRALLKNESLDSFGNLDKMALEETLLGDTSYFPAYVNQFLEQYPDKKDRLYYFPKLVHAFYQEEVEDSRGFLKDYLNFERHLRLLLTAYRAKKLGRDLSKELQFEDVDEEFIVQLLTQKDAKHFDVPELFSDLEPVLEANFNSPLDLQKALNEYRFKKLDEMVDMQVFSMDAILAYLAKYILCQKWMAMDKEQGLKIVDTIIKGKS